MTKDELKKLSELNLDFARQQLQKYGSLLPLLLVHSQGGELHAYAMDTPGVHTRDVVKHVLQSFKGKALAYSILAEAWHVEIKDAPKGLTPEEVQKYANEERRKMPDDLGQVPNREECIMVTTCSYDHTVILTQLFKRSSGGFWFNPEIVTQETGGEHAPMGSFHDMRRLLTRPQ